MFIAFVEWLLIYCMFNYGQELVNKESLLIFLIWDMNCIKDFSNHSLIFHGVPGLRFYIYTVKNRVLNCHFRWNRKETSYKFQNLFLFWRINKIPVYLECLEFSKNSWPHLLNDTKLTIGISITFYRICNGMLRKCLT